MTSYLAFESRFLPGTDKTPVGVLGQNQTSKSYPMWISIGRWQVQETSRWRSPLVVSGTSYGRRYHKSLVQTLEEKIPWELNKSTNKSRQLADPQIEKISRYTRSWCCVLLMPQGRVRQMNPVQNCEVVFFPCNTPGTKRIWAVRFVGSKKKKKGRQWKTIDRHQQDNLPTKTPPFKPLATYQYQYQLHSKFWVVPKD